MFYVLIFSKVVLSLTAGIFKWFTLNKFELSPSNVFYNFCKILLFQLVFIGALALQWSEYLLFERTLVAFGLLCKKTFFLCEFARSLFACAVEILFFEWILVALGLLGKNTFCLSEFARSLFANAVALLFDFEWILVALGLLRKKIFLFVWICTFALCLCCSNLALWSWMNLGCSRLAV